jgi:hypothetical protein
MRDLDDAFDIVRADVDDALGPGNVTIRASSLAHFGRRYR